MKKTNFISFGGLLTALTVLFLYVASVVPSGRLAFLIVASYTVGCAVASAGIIPGVIVYFASAILAVLIIPSKLYAVAFAVFFGSYPILKCYIERLNRLALEWVIKIAVFNVYLVLMYFIAKLFFTSGLDLLTSYPLLFFAVAANAVFVLYDYIFNIFVSKIINLRRV